jgi:hypothetical protein
MKDTFVTHGRRLENFFVSFTSPTIPAMGEHKWNELCSGGSIKPQALWAPTPPSKGKNKATDSDYPLIEVSINTKRQRARAEKHDN